MGTTPPGYVPAQDGSVTLASMSTDQSEGTWTFTDMFLAFPHKRLHPDEDYMVADINISLEADGGGTHGEFGVRWYRFGHDESPYPKLEAFGDAWGVLPASGVLDVLERHASQDGNRLTVDEFKDELRALGFIDKTSSYQRRDQLLPCPTCHTPTDPQTWRKS